MAKHDDGTKIKIRDTDCVKREHKGILTDNEPTRLIEELAEVNPITYATLQGLDEIYRSLKMPEPNRADVRKDDESIRTKVTYEEVLHAVSTIGNGPVSDIAVLLNTYRYIVLPHLEEAVRLGDVHRTWVKSGNFNYPHYRRPRK